eukprot:CAMPEP_0116024612 /NCGR_PEP_ID=MMETSP0321-20121206/12435_1 /TAXON_ID=163516 /ORGANISM="Leptocylindrus danicus var. danicus, Strain B650" /LENGTH=924 /DNA_ID=CAMNT_0003496405 /DNA_START=157 /DNA_END=2931 /DNA_ORIENTATION=+
MSSLSGAFTTKPPLFVDQQKSHKSLISMAPKLEDAAAAVAGEKKRVAAADVKDVYLFREGNKSMREILGGKGANLAEMTNIGLPVPPGFIISTKVCNDFLERNELSADLERKYIEALRTVESQIGRDFADTRALPLLLSVRSGAVASMPGMMDTVLNLGLSDAVVENLIRLTDNPRWVYDTQRRFIHMFSDVVMGIDGELFEKALTELKAERGAKVDLDLDTEGMKELVKRYKEINPNVPDDPYTQLKMSIKAVFASWNNPRAVRYRAYNRIANDSGTAVNVQAMVFGNLNNNCGTGVGFTRNPATGENVFFGEFLINAQGEDVVAGIRTPESLNAIREKWPKIYDELFQIRDQLEKHYRNMQDIEFTIENGKLYMLQTRDGKRTAKGSVKMAIDMVGEGLISREEALLRISPEKMDFFLHPSIDPKAAKTVIASGLPASPGAATGIIVFSPEDAELTAKDGTSVILVRRDTTPEDIHGMKAAQGILTQLGGMTSHAAVVARGMGVVCVSGCEEVTVDVKNEILEYDGQFLRRGDVLTLDGTSGEVLLGDVDKIEIGGQQDEDFQTLLNWADGYRVLNVKANADTPEDAQTARLLGAEGIGLCRTEHMFFNDIERINTMRKMVLAETQEKREILLNDLSVYQKEDMKAIFVAMSGLPVTIRLLDPPLHEFLPKDDDTCEMIGELDVIKKRCEELEEVNPMMGFRGCRLSVVYPEITRMQVTAAISAACEVVKEGSASPQIEIMIPLVSTSKEIEFITPMIKDTITDVLSEYQLPDKSIPYKIGTMIELPRACVRADAIAKAGIDFMSFGTNDLTQSTWGFSRDDMGHFVPSYIEKGILSSDPFVTLDHAGVGSFIRMAQEKALSVSPYLELGVCGEHGGDPESVRFFHEAGLDYVSCSPYRVPIARIAAGQAVIRQKEQMPKLP